ncbi:MAG: hypothetical protein KBS68_02865 [Clostridiales bacterium]|nr:hypothetical protein [Candidatus Crickella merdequi]
MKTCKARFHLPGLFEFHKLYSVFLPLLHEHRDWFYDWCEIGSIYGTPNDCIWSGGRVERSDTDIQDVLELMKKYDISARLTMSNSLIREEHLYDRRCNQICRLFSDPNNGIIVHSDVLADYIRNEYPDYYLVSSTTKVITDFELLKEELDREEFSYVVADFRLNREFASLGALAQSQKDKIEFLCNECCWFYCQDRKTCYESVSHLNMGDGFPEHKCSSPGGEKGYVFSEAMANPGFIGVEDIVKKYLPMGFTNFKIEGRGLGSALILEFILYYMTKPEYQLKVREAIYLDNMLDLF